MGVGQGPLTPFFQIFGTDAAFGAETGSVIFDESEEAADDFTGLEVMAHSRVIEMPVTLFATLERDSTLTIGTTSYRVHDIRIVDDGATRRVALVPV